MIPFAALNIYLQICSPTALREDKCVYNCAVDVINIKQICCLSFDEWALREKNKRTICSQICQEWLYGNCKQLYSLENRKYPPESTQAAAAPRPAYSKQCLINKHCVICDLVLTVISQSSMNKIIVNNPHRCQMSNSFYILTSPVLLSTQL